MLQDLAYGKLENAYRDATPRNEDTLLCFRGNEILLGRHEDDTLTLPTVSQVLARSSDWDRWGEKPLRFAFRLQERDYFLWMGEGGPWDAEDFAYTPVRTLRQVISREICFAVMTGWHLFSWYRSNRFCGRCGSRTLHDGQLRALRCPECGQMIFPRINPAVIVAVTNGDDLLLSKYAGRAYTRYALIAGFTEIGETAEETVAREVMEEVGLHVKNIRYYKSQPWGVDGNLLLGYYCDLDGSRNIHIDENELSMAEWYPRNDLPAKDDGFSLTMEMIRIFEEGKEPKGKT